MQVYDRLKQLYAWLLPGACTLCGAAVARGSHFCPGCERALPRLISACPRCAAALEGPVTDVVACGRCQQAPPSYIGVQAPFRYAPPIDRLIQGAKYAARLDWLAILASQLALYVQEREPLVDALVPVPLHRSRLRERGYNQSLELARPVARHLGLPLARGIVRVRATPPQTDLSGEERRRNMRHAFAVYEELAGARIAVVDDVMTSGATAEAVARCLLKAGAASVEVWVIARA